MTESRSEIKRRVIVAGGSMDDAFDEIKRAESQSLLSGTELKTLEEDGRRLRRLEDGLKVWRNATICVRRSGIDNQFWAFITVGGVEEGSTMSASRHSLSEAINELFPRSTESGVPK